MSFTFPIDPLLRRALDAAAPGTLVRNGEGTSLCYFVKSTEQLWQLCNELGQPYSDRTAAERFNEPLHLGPFATEQLHGYELMILEGG